MTCMTLKIWWIKPGDSGVMIWHQVDGFTHTWLMECFIVFTLVPGVGYQHEPTSHLNQGVRITPVWTKQWLWAWAWHYPPGFCQHTRNGCILWWGWCHAFFSLFRVSNAKIIPFLMIPDCSLFLVSSVIHYSVSLGHSYIICHASVILVVGARSVIALIFCLKGNIPWPGTRCPKYPVLVLKNPHLTFLI